MDFDWRDWKATRNLKKHRVSFSEAATSFGDPLSLTYSDPDHSFDEHRFITIGMSERGRLLIVSHTEQDDAIHIISARETTRAEKLLYEEES